MFSQKSIPLRDNVEKFCTATNAKDDNITQHMRILCSITKATEHTLRIRNHCFSTGKMVTLTRLRVAFLSTLPLVLLFFLQYLLQLTNFMCFSLPGQLSFYSVLQGGRSWCLHVSVWLQRFDAVHSGNLFDLLLVQFSHVSLY